MSIASNNSEQLNRNNSRRQGVFWLLTIPQHEFTPFLPIGIAWIRGQLERGASGYLHWQLVLASTQKTSLAQIRSIFGHHHAELSRSAAANAYVWKDDTAVPNTRFELGNPRSAVNTRPDWALIWLHATRGNLDSIPEGIRFRSYRTIRDIASDFAMPVGRVRTATVFWGPTGTGKSRMAWDQAGMEAYPKDPRTKFWCGYGAQEHVIVDEFRGGIDIAHVLRWLDRYPCHVEIKGGSRPLCAKRYWFTSNIPPREWYPDADDATFAALERRLEIVHFDQL